MSGCNFCGDNEVRPGIELCDSCLGIGVPGTSPEASPAPPPEACPEPVDIPLKRCSTCGQEKPETEYHKHAKAVDGLDHRCKACKACKAKRYISENPPDSPPPTECTCPDCGAVHPGIRVGRNIGKVCRACVNKRISAGSRNRKHQHPEPSPPAPEHPVTEAVIRLNTQPLYPAAAEPQVILSFQKYGRLLDQLEAVAAREFRPLDMQILFYCNQMVAKEEGEEASCKS